MTPDQRTIAEHQILTKDKQHTLYVQEWGSSTGVPILFLHGGPGSGCNDKQKMFFDADKHRVIFVDQRGSGMSTPQSSRRENTTQHLVEDLELIRTELGVKKWHIFGRSWGSTLALCYAISHTKNTLSLIIGGVFLGTQSEIDWVEMGKPHQIFYPDVAIPQSKKLSPLEYTNLVLPASGLDDRYSQVREEDFEADWLKIEIEYNKNQYYLPEHYILKNAHNITVPVYIVQGRYDMITPPKSSYSLHKALPNSTLQWTVAGHSGSDRANFDVSKAILNML